MANPSADLILQFRRMAPGAVLAMPTALLVWGVSETGSDCNLGIDVAADSVGICDLARDADAVTPLDGVDGVAALVDTFHQAHYLARQAAATGIPVGSVVATCPALQMRIRPVDADGLAVIELAGATIRLRGLTYLQLLAESTALLARSSAQFDWHRQQLEGLLEQSAPAVCWERSYGE